jgi:hypothetical protein
VTLGVFHTTLNLECLPFGGGWAEQPAWITAALEILKVEKWRADEEEREERRREAEAEAHLNRYGKR